MNAQDIMNTLHHLLELGDTLDNAGGGVKGLSNGRRKTREACKLQLGQFLLYIADGCPSINDGQAAVLNLVFHEGHRNTSAEHYMVMAKTLDEPDPSENLTLIAFKQGDMALSAQNGTNSTSMTDILINTYEAFGQLMVAMNECFVAQSRFDRLFNQLKSEAYSDTFGGSSASTSSDVDSRTTNRFIIEGNVLTEYNGHSKNIVIPDEVAKIDDDVFSGMDSIETVVLPKSIKTIGSSAFRHCDSLKSINLPEGITEIEYDAFAHCESLTSIDIPSTVKTIGSDAFFFCNGIKKIKIPASLTDIGRDAFMYCDGLETVVVYGGARSNSVLNRMKEHFPHSVKIMWEGSEQGKPRPKSSTATKKVSGKAKKTSTSGKATSSKTAKAQNVNTSAKTITGGQTAKYNERVSFALSREYNMVWDKNDDGDDVCTIIPDKTSNVDSDAPDTAVVVSVVKNDDPDREPIDVIEDNTQDQSTKIRFHSSPDALLSITNIDMQILSMNIRTTIYLLFIQISQEEMLQLSLTKTTSDGENTMMEDIAKISNVWRSIRIDGEDVDLGEADTAQSFVNYVTELSQNEGNPKISSSSKSTTAGLKSKIRKEKMIIRTKPSKFPDAEQYKGIHQVEGEAEPVTPLGTWSIPVLPGYSYTMDPECAGGDFNGKHVLQIQATEDYNFDNAYDSRFSLAILSSVACMNVYSALIDLSKDEAANAMADMASSKDKKYIFLKRTASMAIMTKDEIAKENEYAVLFMVFSQGTQYVAKGKIVIRGKSKEKAKEEINTVLKSISAIQPSEGWEGYVPAVLPGSFALTYNAHQSFQLDSITIPVPDGFKSSTDPKLIGVLREFSIVPSAYNDYSAPMDAAVGIKCQKIEGELPDFSIETCDDMANKLSKLMESYGAFDESIPKTVAQMTTNGIAIFQAVYEIDTKKCIVANTILWVQKAAYIISFALNFDDIIADRIDVRNDALQIVSDWLNRIGLPGEKLYYIPPKPGAKREMDQIANLICPPAPDYLHEHFDLITGGGYTTHHDADFIGQSIRGLMEKEGTTGEDAYDEIKIIGDTYDLDKIAESLAQVFRLDDSLFDPYTDQEALIRLGAFSDVRMLHALRSLSWMVNHFANQQKHSLAEISFADLQRMGELIEKKNYLNYNGESGYIGLCNHYDWHVFYVPDKYLNSRTAMNTDLRYLTGKENRGGNTVSVFFPGLSMDGLQTMNRRSSLISRNEETLESLDELRKDLDQLLPVMRTIFDGFMENRDRSKQLEGALAGALTAWCALAIAAKEPFYSEEAADTPEANAGLSGPMGRPTDDLANRGLTSDGNVASKRTKAINTKDGNDRYLYHGKIDFHDKTFAFYGMVVQYIDILAGRLAMAGGQLRMNVTSKTNYLVAKSIEGKEGVKLKKAKEYIDKGQNLKIILFEDFENALSSAGFTEAVFKAKKKKEEEERIQKREAEERELRKDKLLDLGGASVIKNNQFSYNAISSIGKVIIPEGVITIEQSAFSNAKMAEVVFPSTLRTIGSFSFAYCQNLYSIVFKEGIEEIGFYAFSKCPSLLEVHLPDSLKIVNSDAFVSDDSDIKNHRSEVTLYLSGSLAEYLYAHNPYPGLPVIIAKAFVIDGKRYSTIGEYVKAHKEEEQKRREAEERERRERERREREAAERKSAEERKKAEKDRINEEILDLTNEMNLLKGLFAGMKRKKLQKRIDELNDQLRRL